MTGKKTKGLSIKCHRNGVVSLCDTNIIGKSFEDKNLRLDITERFYKGEEKSEEEILAILQKANNLNIVGKRSVMLALRANIITKEGIRYIKKIPVAYMFSL